MVDHLEVVAKARAALLSGDVRCEAPPVEGQNRWGVTMLLRPDPAMLDTLTAFAQQIAAVAGPGQWAHGPDLLHVSLRSLAQYQEDIAATDPQIAAYAAALNEAADDTPPILASVRTVNPHPHGIGVHVHPHGPALDQLYQRLNKTLHARGLGEYEYWTRDMWYINIVHFAGPVEVDALLAWSDPHRDLEFGTTTLDAAELVRYRYKGNGMKAETLHRTKFRPA